MSDSFAKEEIPDSDVLFMRAPKNLIEDGEPSPGLFRNHGDGMSTDWSKYSTPQDTKKRKTELTPGWQGGVIQMIAGEVRKIPRQVVEHTPLSDNQAHTDVKGPKTTEERYLYMRAWKWAIKFEEGN